MRYCNVIVVRDGSVAENHLIQEEEAEALRGTAETLFLSRCLFLIPWFSSIGEVRLKEITNSGFVSFRGLDLEDYSISISFPYIQERSDTPTEDSLPQSLKAIRRLAIYSGVTPEEFQKGMFEAGRNSPYPTDDCFPPEQCERYVRGELPQYDEHVSTCIFCGPIVEAERMRRSKDSRS